MWNRYWISAALVLASLAAFPAAAQDKLLMTTMSPPGSGNSVRMFRPWADRVNEAAKGAVIVEPRDGATLANLGNVFDRVQDDVVQIGWLLHGLVTGRFPKSDVASLPFLANNAEEASVAFWRLYKTGMLDSEYRDVIPIMFGVFGQYQVHLNKAPRNLDNLNGLKITANGKGQVETIQRLGATVLSLPPQDIYEGIHRGAADGTLIGWSAFDAFKLGEVTNYHIEVPLGTNNTMLFMTRKRYDALSPAGRQALETQGGEAGSRVWGQHLDTQMDAQRELHKPSDKRTVISLNPQQDAQWRRLVEPQLENWASGTPDGAKILASYKAMIGEVRAQIRK